MVIGLFLVVMMAVITFNVAPLLLNTSSPEGGASFNGTPQQAVLILGLFGLITVFGLASGLNGLWQIVTGKRNRWIVLLVVGLGVILLLIGIGARKVLGG